MPPPDSDTLSRSREIIILKKSQKIFNLKFLGNLLTTHFVQRTRPRAIQNLFLEEILNQLSQFLLRLWLEIPNSFFSFFNVYVFINNKRTVTARKIIFLENEGI